MIAIYSYILKRCQEIAGDGLILDYGCGAGELVETGRERGLDIVGVEAFYGGSSAKEIAATRGLLNVTVFPLSEEFRIPYPDETFDLIVSNQVMEHVDDLDYTLAEIARVLKPSGKVLSLFPSAEVIREGHCGIPLAHWFSKKSKWRYPYMRFMRGLGFGYFKKNKSHRQWVKEFMEWLDKYTVYRSYPDIHQIFHKNNFIVKHCETDYFNYRLMKKGILLPRYLQNTATWNTFASKFYRSLAGMVILATKEVRE